MVKCTLNMGLKNGKKLINFFKSELDKYEIEFQYKEENHKNIFDTEQILSSGIPLRFLYNDDIPDRITTANLYNKMKEQKGFVGGTTGRDVHMLIDMFEAVGLIYINKEGIVKKNKFFRKEICFVYKFVNDLEKVYPEIKKYCYTQYPVKKFKIDLCVQILNQKVFIEFDEAAHKTFSKISDDEHKKNYVCHEGDLYVYNENDSYDDFLDSITRCILHLANEKNKNNPGCGDDYVCRYLKSKTDCDYDTIKFINGLHDQKIFNITSLCSNLDYKKKYMKKIYDSCVKKGLIDGNKKRNVKFKDLGILLAKVNNKNAEEYHKIYSRSMDLYLDDLNDKTKVKPYKCTGENFMKSVLHFMIKEYDGIEIINEPRNKLGNDDSLDSESDSDNSNGESDSDSLGSESNSDSLDSESDSDNDKKNKMGFGKFNDL